MTMDKYKDYIETKYNRKLEYIYVEEDGDYVNITYRFEPQKFERIRRITGYLTGTTDSWNTAKQQELKDRVKHGGMEQL